MTESAALSSLDQVYTIDSRHIHHLRNQTQYYQMDHLSPEKRSWNMSRIRSDKTKPEQLVASYLREHHMGYRRAVKDLPGKPDFVLTKYNAVIFVNGCFWHRHEGCKRATTPKTNTEYWNSKFQRNIERDKEAYQALEENRWRVFVIWECELGKEATYRLHELVKEILMVDDENQIPDIFEEELMD